MKNPIIPFVLPAVVFLLSCHSSGDQRTPGKDTLLVDPSKPPPATKHNPEFRSTVKKEPVAEYHEKTGSVAGDFDVKLYQTPKTMYYRAEVEYESLPGTDTIKLPDLGTAPQPVLVKGGTKFSCIIGFLDKDKQFRELKLVHVTPKGDQLKISTLRHWVVTDNYRLVSE